MEATTLSSHCLHFNLLRAKPFRNRGGLVVPNLQFNHTLYAGTYLSLRNNGSRSLRRHFLLLRAPLTSERNKRLSVYCSDQPGSNHLTVEAKPVHSDAGMNELSSSDISKVKDLQTKSEMFRNRFLNFVRLGSVFNDAAESFFKSEICRRLFVTALLIAVSRIGYFIPLPGFDRRLVPKDYLSFVSGTAGVLTLMNHILGWWMSLGIAIFEGLIIACCSLPYSIYATSHRVRHVMVATFLMVSGAMFMSWLCNKVSESGFGCAILLLVTAVIKIVPIYHL